jgi:hypothetical protein
VHHALSGFDVGRTRDHCVSTAKGAHANQLASDVIDTATRPEPGTLATSAKVVSANFVVSNTVVNISVKTGGEGPFSGEESGSQ